MYWLPADTRGITGAAGVRAAPLAATTVRTLPARETVKRIAYPAMPHILLAAIIFPSDVACAVELDTPSWPQTPATHTRTVARRRHQDPAVRLLQENRRPRVHKRHGSP